MDEGVPQGSALLLLQEQHQKAYARVMMRVLHNAPAHLAGVAHDIMRPVADDNGGGRQQLLCTELSPITLTPRSPAHHSGVREWQVAWDGCAAMCSWSWQGWSS